MNRQHITNSKYNALDFGFDFEILPKDVEMEIKKLSKTRAGQICKDYESTFDYFTIFFGLRFKDKYSNNEISEKLNKGHDCINQIFEGLNWEYDNDYETNQRKYAEHYSKLQKHRQNGINKIGNIDVAQYPQLKEMLENPTKIKMVKKIIKSGTCGDSFADYQDFMKQLYYFYCIEVMSPKEICKMFGWYKGTMQGWLKKLEIRRSSEEGMKAKIKNKSQDYYTTFSNGRDTRRKSQLKYGAPTSSKNENAFRNAIADYIYDCFPRDTYDIGVCCNAIGILETKEIDIPLFIYNVKTDELRRYVVEYNGPDHTEDSDNEKIRQAEARGWAYIAIIDKNEYSNNRNSLIEEARSFCKQLADLILTK